MQPTDISDNQDSARNYTLYFYQTSGCQHSPAPYPKRTTHPSRRYARAEHLRCSQLVFLPRQARKPQRCVGQESEGRPESRLPCRRRVVQHEDAQTVLLRGGTEEAHERRHFGMSL